MEYTAISADISDLEFAHDLTRSNMSQYYAELNRSWSRSVFESSWPETENYRLQISHEIVGILRLSTLMETLYLRDMQVHPNHQNRGAGSFAIRFAQNLAADRKLSKLGLRVFTQNPAKSLYYRLGFKNISNEGNILVLEKSIA